MDLNVTGHRQADDPRMLPDTGIIVTIAALMLQQLAEF